MVKTTLPYRADIDGLRAIAVLGVLFYHAGLPFSGGFTGVDVFFVISGYLITSLIAAEMAEGRFSVLGFFERRARRILPALFVVMALCAVVAGLMFLPPEFTLFGRSMALAALSVSNIGFWMESGYFDSVAVYKPLLHTWSLGVEEQFYLVFPLLLLALRSSGKRSTTIAVLAGISFGLGLWLVRTAPEAAFFLLPSRFWELAAGALLALATGLRLQHQKTAALVSLLGLVSIIIGYLTIGDADGFPGLPALLPVAGACLIILGGRTSNTVSSLLGSTGLRFVGQISYSLYLVHWPLIVFVQYHHGHLLTPGGAVITIAVSLILASLLWYSVEQPFRQRRFLATYARFAPATATLAAGLIVAGFGITLGKGFPQRLPEDIKRIYAAKADVTPFKGCVLEAKTRFTNTAPMQLSTLCSLGQKHGKPDFLLWGDSHAAAMAPALDAAAVRAGRQGAMAVHGGCPPLLDYDVPNPSMPRRTSCREFNAAVMQMINREKPSQVVLVARWPRELLGVENGREGAFYDPSEPYQRQDRSPEVGKALEETLASIRAAGAEPVLVMDVPEPGYDVPVAMARALMQRRNFDVNPKRSLVADRQALERKLMQTVSADWSAPLVDPTTAFCNASICRAEINGRPLYADADHLTRTAAIGISHLFDGVLQRNDAAFEIDGIGFGARQSFW